MPLTPAEASPREEPALEGRTGETGTAATSSGGWGVEAREEDGTTGAEKRLDEGRARLPAVCPKCANWRSGVSKERNQYMSTLVIKKM
jgi:hypothetical protein